ncbi:MAG: hypothetical protein LJE63_04080 [Desulfobacteraceae bacterium]|nr:hypothetical protein [Desulfobacteraceae bacterium]
MRVQTFWTAFPLACILACGFFLGSLSFAQQAPEFAVLKGRWVRPDGGYVIEIRGVDVGGRMQAAYYNPKPITVSRAEATRLGAAVAVFIELRAPGYPGSTYTLVHDPKSDRLQGIYHHAGLQEDFEVVFVRGK